MRVFLALLALIVGMLWGPWGTGAPRQADSEQAERDASTEVLSPQQWAMVDQSVERALGWLAAQQQRDGSFPTLPTGQPGVTGLCVMAFYAHGHLPGSGPYGDQLQKALDYIISCQKRSGLLVLVLPNTNEIPRQVSHDIGYTAAYNHAIAGLVLSESYAMNGAERAQKLKPVIQRALEATLTMQKWPKTHSKDLGGWRYVDHYDDVDSDLSVTGWQLMFLRSSANAGFEVEEEPIRDAVEYVRRCFLEQYGTFSYKTTPDDRTSRGMSGAGILALAHAGFHHSREARAAGDWLLHHGFEHYNAGPSNRNDTDRYHYGLFTCSQGMYQLGGRYWQEFFPPTVEALLANQQSDGSWLLENHQNDTRFGTAYTTALTVLALGAPNQLLPIFQR